MVRIRLRRVGKKKQPSFRMVAADRESPRDGRFLENLGFYNPRTEPATIKLKEGRIFEWMSNGAQPSDAAQNVMRVSGTLERYERFKAGEDLEKLLEEAAAGDATRNISSKTRREPPVGKPKAEKPKAEVVKEDYVEADKEEEVKEEAKAEEVIEEPKADEKKESKTEKPPLEKEAPEEKKAEEEAKEVPAVTSSRASVEKLELPANITSALNEGGFKTIGKLAKQVESDPQPLLDLSGIGPKAIETIEEKIKAFQP